MAYGAELTGAAQAGAVFGHPDTSPDGDVFGPGTVGRWMLIWWIVSFVWLLIIWRVIADGSR